MASYFNIRLFACIYTHLSVSQKSGVKNTIAYTISALSTAAHMGSAFAFFLLTSSARELVQGVRCWTFDSSFTIYAADIFLYAKGVSKRR